MDTLLFYIFIFFDTLLSTKVFTLYSDFLSFCLISFLCLGSHPGYHTAYIVMSLGSVVLAGTILTFLVLDGPGSFEGY